MNDPQEQPFFIQFANIDNILLWWIRVNGFSRKDPDLPKKAKPFYDDFRRHDQTQLALINVLDNIVNLGGLLPRENLDIRFFLESDIDYEGHRAVVRGRLTYVPKRQPMVDRALTSADIAFRIGTELIAFIQSDIENRKRLKKCSAILGVVNGEEIKCGKFFLRPITKGAGSRKYCSSECAAWERSQSRKRASHKKLEKRHVSEIDPIKTKVHKYGFDRFLNEYRTYLKTGNLPVNSLGEWTRGVLPVSKRIQ